MPNFLFYFSLIAVFFVSNSQTSNAQDKRIGISTEYNLPGGKLKWIYKNSIGVQLKYSSVSKKKRGSYFGYGVALGYTNFKPIADTLYYLVELGFGGTGYGTAVYGNRTILQLTGSFFWTFPVRSKKIEFLIGSELGYYYIYFDYSFKDDISSTSGKEIEGKGALVPSVGVGFYPTKNLRFEPYFKYNLFFSVGSSDPKSSTYNSNFGSFDYFYSLGLNISYAF